MKTATDLGADLRALDLHLEGLHEQADALSLRAVENDGSARKKLSDLLATIARMQAERKIFARAHTQTVAREAEQAEQADAATQEQHRADACEKASRLLEVARNIDRAQAAMLPMLAELSDLERSIWQSLRLAGASPTGMIVGQRDLSGMAMERLTLAAQNRAMFQSDQRSIAAVAEIAWRDLLPMPEEI